MTTTTKARELPRFTKVGTDRHALVHSTERDTGHRATFHVYYREKGKLRFDPSWRTSPEEAIKDIEEMGKELRVALDIVGYVRVAEVAL